MPTIAYTKTLSNGFDRIEWYEVDIFTSTADPSLNCALEWKLFDITSGVEVDQEATNNIFRPNFFSS